jgi:hypothetical protein
MNSGLTDKERLFVEHVLAGKSDRQAAKAAGYSNWAIEGVRLRRRPDVAALMSERVSAVAMEADEVLQRLADVARSPIGDYIRVNGNIRVDLKKMISDGYGHCIKAIKNTQHGQNIEVHDALSALNTLARHHGILNDRLTVDKSDWEGQQDDAIRAFITRELAAAGNPGSEGTPAPEA